MLTNISRGVRLFACATTLLLAASANAQDVDDATRAAARKLGTEGVESYQAGKFALASEKLEKAYQMLHAPSLGLWSARALASTGRLLEAQERYVIVTRLPISSGDTEVQKKALADAASELAALTPRVPSLIIQLEGAQPSEVQLSIDGKVVTSAFVGEARPVNPGAHQVVALRGKDRASSQVTVQEKEQKQALLRFSSAQAPDATAAGAAPPSAAGASGASATTDDAGASSSTGKAQRTAGWVSLAVGGAGLVFGGVTGALALGKKSSIDGNARCANNQCGPSQQSTVDSYNSLRTLSSVGIIAGSVLAATGVVLLLSAPSSSQTSTALLLSPNGASIARSF